ncbi:hypothetical protein KJA13_03165 [Patescibacteria group bacterium]|nr:hypothetical protein [Patescibacteria group bacterium]
MKKKTKKTIAGILGFVGVVAFVIFIFSLVIVIAVIEDRDTLVEEQEFSFGGAAMFSSAINNRVEPLIQTIWEMFEQANEAEKGSYIGYAEARSSYEDAKKVLEETVKAGDEDSSPLNLQRLIVDKFGKAFGDIKVTIEAAPQNVRITENFQKVCKKVNDAYSELHSECTKWITVCQTYNTHRRSAFTSVCVYLFYPDRKDFPKRIEYYQGGLTNIENYRIDVEKLRSDG